MEHTARMAALIAEGQEALGEELAKVGATLVSGDLAQLETQLQGVSRRVFGRLVAGALAAGVAALPGEEAVCGRCGQPMRRVAGARGRHVVGLVGDFVLRRPYWHCAPCARGEAPVDAQLGLGAGTLAPALQRVVRRSGITAAFEASVAVVSESLGVPLDGEAVRRSTEGIGAVAEAELQAVITRVQ